MIGKTKILLCDLKFGHNCRLFHGSEQRAEWFTGLEIYRTVLDLHNNIIPKFIIQRFKFKIGLFGTVAVGRRINESAPHHNAMIGPQHIGKHIGSFGMSPSVVTRTGLPFGIRFHQKTSEIGNQRINLFGFLLPPVYHFFIQRIGSG